MHLEPPRQLGLGAVPLMKITYVIQAKGGGPVKVGRTGDVDSRLRSLMTGCPLELVVRGVIKGDKEREIHERLQASRVHGEWFDADEQTVAVLREYGVDIKAGQLTTQVELCFDGNTEGELQCLLDRSGGRWFGVAETNVTLQECECPTDIELDDTDIELDDDESRCDSCGAAQALLSIDGLHGLVGVIWREPDWLCVIARPDLQKHDVIEEFSYIFQALDAGGITSELRFLYANGDVRHGYDWKDASGPSLEELSQALEGNPWVATAAGASELGPSPSAAAEESA